MKPVYELLWRNKWLTADAQTIDDMITMLEGAVTQLRRMRDAGVVLSDDSGTQDDYARLVTSDPTVADEFNFDRVEYDDEDDGWIEDSGYGFEN